MPNVVANSVISVLGSSNSTAPNLNQKGEITNHSGMLNFSYVQIFAQSWDNSVLNICFVPQCKHIVPSILSFCF